MKSLKAFLKQKTGMTFVEILVAMSVLMLVIVSFTPMLLHSYDSLYTAGEINEKTYDAKSTVEEGLATRSSTDILYNIQTNFKNIGKVADVNLRRAVSATGSDLKDGIESLFYGGKGTLKIISGKRVNDDTIDKTILIKTSGIVLDKVVAGKASDAKMTKNGKEFKYTIAVSVIAPDWSKKNDGDSFATSETQVYDLSDPLTNITCSFDKAGLITVKIPNQDLTSSPLKIIVYYYDETTKLNNTGTAPASGEAPREATTFLYIDPPTLLLAGKTESNGVYYTSAGIETANDGSSTMKVEKRNMTAAGNFSVPGLGSTVIKNVTWVDNDATGKYGNYYVLTGTNGAIMRLYPSLTATAFQEIQANTATTSTKNPVSIKDSGLTKTIYPTLWGGDYSHQFIYSSYSATKNTDCKTDYGAKNSESGRKDDQCWRTEASKNSGVGQPGIYGTQAQYSYQYNGMEVNFEFNVQKRRCISYILTETGWALRCAGEKMKEGDFKGYQEPWEHCAEDWIYHDDSATAYKVIRWYHGGLHLYLADVKDNHIANLAVKSLNSFSIVEALRDNDQGGGWITGASYNAMNRVVVTDATYIPSLGKMFYLGNVGAYSEVMQLDNTNTGSEYAKKYVYGTSLKKNLNMFSGSFSGYLFIGSNDGSGTTVYKKVETGGSFDTIVKNGWYTQTASLVDLGNNSSKHIKQGETDKQNAFYVNRNDNNAFFPDVLFTLGYSSNREAVYSNVTYDGTNEYYKSYERYYWLSHYGTQSRTPNFAVNGTNNEDKATGDDSNRNIPNNDYYNVWFPGEMYNLTKTVTKEGVTVAVGYTVSGSSYQYINPSQITNTSTALGGVFNDGVLAVMTDQTTKFQNLLYFKDNATMDADYLTTVNTQGKDKYVSAYGTYGTHVRDSVQFTAVDIQVLATRGKDDTADSKTYYAIYGDNKGRVFKSKIATATATYKPEEAGSSTSGSSVSVVDYIGDLTCQVSNPPSKMEEITLNGASLSTYFKSISTIVCDDTTVIISGVPRSSTYGNTVIVGVAVVTQTQDTETTTWKWGHVELASSSYLTNVAKIVDGNYYAAGTYNTSKGFLLGIPLNTIKDAVQQGVVDLRSKVLVDNTHITTPVYGMDGRGANG